jgi:hypothetical protein
MIFPRIHLNGTNGRALYNDYKSAIEVLGDAIYAVEQITVHGRDYYVQATATGPDPSCVAMDEHRARITQLRNVYRDLTTIAINLQEQLFERKQS